MSTIDRYVVMGNPVAHSLSPFIHAAFAAQTSQTLLYERVLVPLGEFAKVVSQLKDAGVRGANVTLPFKVDAFNYATQHTERAKRAGAVNTLVFEKDRVVGDNTDGVGLCRDLKNRLGFELQGAQLLLLGAGGAARGVLGELLAENPASLVIANRSANKAHALVAQWRQDKTSDKVDVLKAVGIDDVGEAAFDLVINATSASLSGVGNLIPASCFGKGCLAYDMMYGKEVTPFLAAAQTAGARIADGLGMLVEQAAEAFFLWRQVRPDTSAVFAQLRVRS